MKQGKALYDYLTACGVLEQGTAADILSAKSIYWQEVRRAWKEERRNTQKSYTIFFTNAELKSITAKTKKLQSSVTGFVKHSALAAAKEEMFIDKKITGTIRSLLYDEYSSIETILEDAVVHKKTAQQLLKQILSTEQKILEALGVPEEAKNNMQW